MRQQLGILPNHIRDIPHHPQLDKALCPGKLYKTLRLVLPQYGFTPGYPETLLARARRILRAQKDAGVGTLSCFDGDDPKSLAALPDFHPLIDYTGDPSRFFEPTRVAVTGVRNVDRTGDEAAWAPD